MLLFIIKGPLLFLKTSTREVSSVVTSHVQIEQKRFRIIKGRHVIVVLIK